MANRLKLLVTVLFAVACTDPPPAVDVVPLDDASPAGEIADDVTPPDDTAPTDIWPDDWSVPSTMEQLYGYWQNDDGETVRDLQFDQFDLYDPDMLGVSPVYWLYSYPKGGAKVLIERGRATLVLGPRIHLGRVWSSDVTTIGQVYELTLLAAAPKTFAIATGTNGARVYTRVF